MNDVFQQSFNKEAECCISTENIPEQFRVDLNGQSYHVGNLILAILTQDQPRDIYTRQKIDSETLGLLANYMGVPSESFQNIWNEVTTSQVELKKADIVQHKWNTQPDANFEDIMKQVYDSNEVATHMRFEKLYHLLTANQMPSDEKALRENFLTFLRRQDVWKKFEKSQQGWMLLV